MGIELAKAFVTIRADSSRLSSDFSKVQKKTGQLMSGISSQIRGMLAGLGVIGIGAAFAAAGREATTFEDTMVKVRINARLLGKEGEASFKLLEKEARRLGATTRFTSVEAADAMNKLVLAGLDVDQTLVATESTLNLAAAADIGLAEAAAVATKNMKIQNLEVRELSRISDTLVSAQSRVNATVSELNQAVVTAGAIARKTGLDFEELTAILGLMVERSNDAGTSGTALTIALFRLSKPPKEASDALRDLNVNVEDFRKASGEIDILPLLSQLSKLKLTVGQVGAIFGARGKEIIKLFEAVDSEGRVGMDAAIALAQALRDDVGFAAEAASARMNTFLGILLKLKSALSELAIAGLTPVLKALEPLVGVFTKLTGAISFLTEKFSDLNKMTDGFIANALLATLGVLAFVEAITLIGPAVAGAVIAVELATITSGWGLMIVAVGLAIAGIIVFVRWLKNTEVVQRALSKNTDKFRMVWERLKQVFVAVGEVIIETFNRIIAKIVEMTDTDIPKIADSIEQATSDAIDFIAEFALDTAEWFLVIANNSDKAWEIVKDGFKVAISFMGDVLSNFVKAWKNALEKIGKTTASLFGSLPKLIKGLAKGSLRRVDVAGEIEKLISEGMKGTLETKGLLDPSKRTKELMRDIMEGAVGDLLEEKATLERGRGSLLPKRISEAEAEKQAEKQGEVFGQAAGNQIDDILTSLIGERLGFREFGKTIQDALLKGGKDDKDEKRNSLLEQGIKKQDDIIKAIKEQELVQGALI